MIFSKTTEYALRVLAYMASNNKGLYTAKYLHEQLNIPYKYLTKLMTDLVKSGCLKSTQGREGGFSIIKDPSKFSLADIIEAVEGYDGFSGCILGLPDCSDENPCAMHYVWEKNRNSFINTLETTTLAELVKQRIVRF
jgi:Rrf2 family protein